MSSHLSHSSSQAGSRCAFLAGSRRILCFSTSMKVRATKMGTADLSFRGGEAGVLFEKGRVPRFDLLERTRAGVGHRHALADEVAHITRGMRQREPVEVDHGHPIAQDVDVFRLEVSVSRHDLSRVQRLQGGEYAARRRSPPAPRTAGRSASGHPCRCEASSLRTPSAGRGRRLLWSCAASPASAP